MFSSLASNLIQKYIGHYVKAFSSDNLNVKLKGEAQVSNLELREDALSHFSDLPIIVKKGYLRSLLMKLPWHSLGSDSTVIDIEGVFVVAGPRGRELPDFGSDPAKLEEALWREKSEKLALHELITSGKPTEDSSDNMAQKFLGKALNNIKVRVRNVHIRYEDITSKGEPFAFGVTLNNLSLDSTDTNWRPTFISSDSAPDLLYKLARVEALSAYWDHNCPHVPTNDFIPTMERMISATNHNYIVPPLSFESKIVVNQNGATTVPRIAMNICVSNICLELNRQQYTDLIELAVAMHSYHTNISMNMLLRPSIPPRGREGARKWFKYAILRVLAEVREKKYRRSWDYIALRREHRIEYIACWQRKLTKHENKVDKEALTRLEKVLSFEDIIFFRSLASMQLKQQQYQKAAKRKSAAPAASSVAPPVTPTPAPVLVTPPPATSTAPSGPTAASIPQPSQQWQQETNKKLNDARDQVKKGATSIFQKFKEATSNTKPKPPAPTKHPEPAAAPPPLVSVPTPSRTVTPVGIPTPTKPSSPTPTHNILELPTPPTPPQSALPATSPHPPPPVQSIVTPPKSAAVTGPELAPELRQELSTMLKYDSTSTHGSSESSLSMRIDVILIKGDVSISDISMRKLATAIITGVGVSVVVQNGKWTVGAQMQDFIIDDPRAPLTNTRWNLLFPHILSFNPPAPIQSTSTAAAAAPPPIPPVFSFNIAKQPSPSTNTQGPAITPDYKIQAKLRGSEIIIQKEFILSQIQFFSIPPSLQTHIQHLTNDVGRWVRAVTEAELQMAIEKRQALDIGVEFVAPKVIIPVARRSEPDDVNTPFLILDFGLFHAKSQLQPRDNLSSTEALESAVYDVYKIKLTNMLAAVILNPQSNWRSLLTRESRSVPPLPNTLPPPSSLPSESSPQVSACEDDILHLIDPLDVQLTVQRSLVRATPQLPQIKLDAKIPLLSIHINSTQALTLANVITSTMITPAEIQQTTGVYEIGDANATEDTFEVTRTEPEDNKLLEVNVLVCRATLQLSKPAVQGTGGKDIAVVTALLENADVSYIKYPYRHSIKAVLESARAHDHFIQSADPALKQLLVALPTDVGHTNSGAFVGCITAKVVIEGSGITVGCWAVPISIRLNLPTLHEVLQIAGLIGNDGKISLAAFSPPSSPSTPPAAPSQTIMPGLSLTCVLQQLSLHVSKNSLAHSLVDVGQCTLNIDAKQRGCVCIGGEMTSMELRDESEKAGLYPQAFVSERGVFSLKTEKRGAGSGDSELSLMIQGVQFCFFAPFLLSMVDNITLFVSGVVPTSPTETVETTNTDMMPSSTENKPRLHLNITIPNPMLKLPRSYSSQDFLLADFGNVQINNSWETDQTGSWEVTSIVLKDARVCMCGEEIGNNVSGLLRVCKPIADALHPLPEDRPLTVIADLSEMSGTFRQTQFNFLIGMGFENFDAYTPQTNIYQISPLVKPDPWVAIKISVPKMTATLAGVSVSVPGPAGIQTVGPTIGTGLGLGVNIGVTLKGYTRTVTATVDSLRAIDQMQPYGESVSNLIWEEETENTPTSGESSRNHVIDFYYHQLRNLDKTLAHTIDFTLKKPLHANANHCTILALISFFNPLPTTWGVIHPPTKKIIPDKFKFGARIGSKRDSGGVRLWLNNGGTQFAVLELCGVTVEGTHDESTRATSMQGQLETLAINCLSEGRPVPVLFFPPSQTAVTFNVNHTPNEHFLGVDANISSLNLLYNTPFLQNTLVYTTELKILASILATTTTKAVTTTINNTITAVTQKEPTLKTSGLPTKLHLAIVCSCPHLVVPGKTNVALVADFGKLAITDVSGEAISILLSDANIYLQEENQLAEHKLLNNLDLKLELALKGENGVTMQACLPSLIFSMSKKECDTLTEIVAQSIPLNNKSQLLHEEEKMIPHQLQDPSSISKALTASTTISMVQIPASEVAPSPRVVSLFSARFELKKLSVELIDVAQFEMLEFLITNETASTGSVRENQGEEVLPGLSISTTVLIPRITIYDTRPERSPFFKFIIEQVGEDALLKITHIFDTNPPPHQPQHRIHTGISSFKGYLIPHSVRAFINFFSSSRVTAAQIPAPKALSKPKKSVALPIQFPPIELSVCAASPEILLLEDPSRSDTHAIGVHFNSASLKLLAGDVEEIQSADCGVNADLIGLEVFSCRLDQQATTQVHILQPFIAMISAKVKSGPNGGEVDVKVSLGVCDVTIAYNDVKLLIITGLTLAPPSPTKISQSIFNSSTPLKDFAPQPLLSCNIDQNSKLVQTAMTSAPKQILEATQGRSLSVEMTIPNLCLTIVNDFAGSNTPIANVLISETKGTFTNKATSPEILDMKFVLCCRLESNYFNDSVSAWEPLIEPWEFGTTYTYIAQENANTYPNLSLASQERLEVNITPNFVASVMSVAKLWLKDYTSYRTNLDGTISRTQFHPYTLRNCLGETVYYQLRYTRCSSGGQQTETNKVAIPISDGKEEMLEVTGGNTSSCILSVRLFRSDKEIVVPWIPLNRVGGYAFRCLWPGSSVDTSTVVVTVSLERACKVVTVSSGMTVNNNTLLPVLIQVSSQIPLQPPSPVAQRLPQLSSSSPVLPPGPLRSSTHQPGKILLQPGEVYYIPIVLLGNCFLQLHPDPTLGDYQWSSPVRCSVFKAINVSCTASTSTGTTGDSGLPVMHYVISAEQTTNPTPHSTLASPSSSSSSLPPTPAVVTELLIGAPIEVFNGLLCDLHYQIREGNKISGTGVSSPQQTQAPLIAGVLSSCKSEMIHNISLSSQVWMRVKIPFFGVWSPPDLIWDPTQASQGSKFKVKQNAIFQHPLPPDQLQQQQSALLTTQLQQHNSLIQSPVQQTMQRNPVQSSQTQAQSQSRGMWGLIFSSASKPPPSQASPVPTAPIPTTTLVIQCAGKMRNSARASVSCQFWVHNHTTNPLQFDNPLLTINATAPNTPQPFSTSPPTTHVIRTRIEGLTQWSQPFSIHHAGDTIIILPSLKHPTKPNSAQATMVYELLLNTQLLSAPLDGVRVLTFTPHYVLHNSTPLSMLLHIPDSGASQALDQDMSFPLYCIENKQIKVKLANYLPVAIPVDVLDTYVLRLHNESEVYFVSVEVKMIGAVEHISVTSCTPRDAPFIVENHTDTTISWWQADAPQYALNVPPKHVAPFAWDDVSKARTVVLCNQGLVVDPDAFGVLQEFEVPPSGIVRKFRKLSVKVKPKGPARVVKVMNTADVGKVSIDTVIDERTVLQLNIAFGGIGISLLNTDPRELLYVSFDGVMFHVCTTTDSQALTSSIHSLQVDYQLPHPKYPVLLCRGPMKKEEDEAAPMICLDIQRTLHSASQSTLIFQTILVHLAPIELLIEEETIVHIYSFAEFVTQEVNKALSNAQTAVQTSSLKSTSPALSNSTFMTSTLPVSPDISSPAQPVAPPTKVFIGHLLMSPVKIDVTFSPTVGYKHEKRSMNALSRFLGTVAFIDCAQIRFTELVADEIFTPVGSLVERIGQHFKSQWASQVFQLLGSSAVLGKPALFARNIKAGVQDLASADGLGFISHTAFAVTNSASAITSTVSKSLWTITGDTNTMAARQKRTGPNNVGQGLVQGVRNLGEGLFYGVTGVVTQPVHGAVEGGVSGAALGLVGGLVGVAAKPIAGLFDAAASTTQGLSKLAQGRVARTEQRRPPRVIPHLNKVLTCYSQNAANAQYLMHSVSDGAFSKEEYCDHIGFLRELNDKMWLVNVVVSNLHAFHIDQRGGHKPALQAYCTHKEIALMMQASKTAQIVEKLAIPVGPEDVATRESVVALFERNKLLFSFQLL